MSRITHYKICSKDGRLLSSMNLFPFVYDTIHIKILCKYVNMASLLYDMLEIGRVGTY